MPRRSPVPAPARPTGIDPLELSTLAVVAQCPNLDAELLHRIRTHYVRSRSGRRTLRLLLGQGIPATTGERLRATALRYWAGSIPAPPDALTRGTLPPNDSTVLAVLAEKPAMPRGFADLFLSLLRTASARRVGLLLLGRTVHASAREHAAARAVADWFRANRSRVHRERTARMARFGHP